MSMPNRFDGFYVVRYEGLNYDARYGFGVMTLKDGRVFGGDSLRYFAGKFVDGGNTLTADMRIFPVTGPYHSVTDLDDKPWELPDIRGAVPQGELPLDVELTLDGQRYDTHHAVTILLKRLAVF
jgi:hypothetical protein